MTVLWCLGALCWLPWLALAVRLLIAFIPGLGGNWEEFVKPALVGVYPGIGFGWWPPARWLVWTVVSFYPVMALVGMLLCAAGWRVYWLEQSGVLTRPAWLVALSVIVPPIAPFIMWADAWRRHLNRERELQTEVEDARGRLERA